MTTRPAAGGGALENRSISIPSFLGAVLARKLLEYRSKTTRPPAVGAAPTPLSLAFSRSVAVCSRSALFVRLVAVLLLSLVRSRAPSGAT